MHKHLVYIILLFSLRVYGQPSPPPITEKVVEEIDSLSHEDLNLHETDSLLHVNEITDNTLLPKDFDPDFQDKYTDEEYDYTLTKPRRSLWDRFMDKMSYYLSKLFSKEIDGLDKIARYIIYTLCTLIIGGGIYYLIKLLNDKNGNWLFSKKNKSVLPEESDIEENIHEINFPEIIARHEQEGDYRSAIRYQFLSVLKVLTDQGKIQWHQQKTNSDYVLELGQSEEKKQFEKVAYIFDYIWYGEFPIDKEKYEALIPQFQTLKNTVYE